jgi:predicted aspartyl protease
MGMGLFHVEASLIGPKGVREDLSLLVDTGATFLVIPQDVASRLDLRPTRACPLRLAGGRTEVWPLAEVRLRLAELEVTTPCLIGPDGPALLGAVALESLLLAVDPVAKRLLPVEAFVGRVRPTTCGLSNVEEAF